MTFRDYTIEEFLEHPSFRMWVLEQDEAAATFWETWMEEKNRCAGTCFRGPGYPELMANTGTQASASDEAQVWNRIQHTIDTGNSETQGARVVQMPGTPQPAKRNYRWVAYAAAFVGILIATFFLYPGKKETFSTAMGEMKTIVLPDNSVVRLNVNSTISYEKEWSNDVAREVWVTGEAFFSVMHKSNNQQFVVHTNDVDIQVVGTEFNVNTRRVKTQVVLNNGVVKLKLNGDKVPASHQHQPITMKPGDMIVYSAATAELAAKRVNPEEYSSWRTNVLTFHDTPVADVIKSLHDNMGVVISLQDTALNGQTFTGSIPMDNIDVFFKTLSRSFEIKISKTGDGVYEISQQ
ncbi:FecR domain-containing protein [Chitinophaga sedimenti]|uniref:FecR family protein n=1 Tax=Chitinophaga sedimenti TaxID=2033606 RepID=UPI0020062B9E|nr:FecR domain-containing protein [Chitinophaga sedimenti]MCK7557790.1 FecR domain-containing protein [Chitinophaga sedimenti]